MHLDKLQVIATTPVAPKHKIIWLKWWNSGLAIRDTYYFPRPLCSESQLLPWLNRASFYAGLISQFLSATYCSNSTCTLVLSFSAGYNVQLEDEAVKVLDDLLPTLDVQPVKFDSLPTYLLKWRCKLWEKAYMGNFTGTSQFSRATKWEDWPAHKRFAMRLVHRYLAFQTNSCCLPD
jgi:hypothetical protein